MIRVKLQADKEIFTDAGLPALGIGEFTVEWGNQIDNTAAGVIRLKDCTELERYTQLYQYMRI